MDEFDIIPELSEWLKALGAVCTPARHRRQHGWTCPQLPCRTVVSCFSQERALNVKVKYGAQLHAQHARDVHGGPRSVSHSNTLCKCFSGSFT